MQAGRLRSQWLSLFFVYSSFFLLFPPQSFPVALELRRVGVGHRPRITVGADAAELQGPWSALKPRPRPSSSSPPGLRSRQYFLDHVSVDVGEPALVAAVIETEALVVETQ